MIGLRKTDLFTGGIEVSDQGSHGVSVGDGLYHLFFVFPDHLTYEDGKAINRARYIANAANHFDELCGVLKDILDNYECGSEVDAKITAVLGKVRGES